MDLRSRDVREIIHRPTRPGSTRLFIPLLLLCMRRTDTATTTTTPLQRLRHPFLPRGPPPPTTTTPFPFLLHRLALRLPLRQLDFPSPLHLIEHEPGRREREDADGDADANSRHGARARVFLPASSGVVGAGFLVQEGLGGGGEGGGVEGPEGGWGGGGDGEGGEVEGDALGDVGYVCGGGELEGAGLVGGW